jgi:type I restriction enzyme M protein
LQTRQLVAKVWSLCSLLRDDGITYQDYLTELSWLIYLRLASRQARPYEDQTLGNAWRQIIAATSYEQLDTYKVTLKLLSESSHISTAQIFSEARTCITNYEALNALAREIDDIPWESLSTQMLGDIYEGILQRNATEQKSGAGQYFTPRILVDLMVRTIAPTINETVQDPAAGTGGFLVSAHAFARASTMRHVQPTRPGDVRYFGIELVQGAYRLCTMNLSLHGVPSLVWHGNALGRLGAELPRPDIIITNPPFGAKRGLGVSGRSDFNFPRTNKQLAFLQHAYQTLRPGGRAAIIVPESVLFDQGVGKEVRRELLRDCNLHTILRLPDGLFYAESVKTNVLFFERAAEGRAGDATDSVWIYDARSGVSGRASMPRVAATFSHFENLYKLSNAGRHAAAASDWRFRRFTRSEIAANNDRLDLAFEPASPISPNADLHTSLAALRGALTRALSAVGELEAEQISNGAKYDV